MSWEVHKFGGASVKDAEGVRNVGRILRSVCQADGCAAVVVSAMGKTTNALEKVWSALPQATGVEDVVGDVWRFHREIIQELGLSASLLDEDGAAFRKTAQRLSGCAMDDAGYDALVGFGERFSTRIVHAHLESLGLNARWHSGWQLFMTDDTHRSAGVDVVETGQRLRSAASSLAPGGLLLTQGFVGGTENGVPTTLGREGSDFSGALMAEALGAERLVVWKDVPGVMTGDPRRWPLARPLKALDYDTAERMSQAGAGILHPATMAPLRRADIPLEVRSFLDPDAVGTAISGSQPPSDLPGLWAFSQDDRGEVVRCLTLDEAEMRKEWNAAFPGMAMEGLEKDAVISRCYRFRPQDSVR